VAENLAFVLNGPLGVSPATGVSYENKKIMLPTVFTYIFDAIFVAPCLLTFFICFLVYLIDESILQADCRKVKRL
jgi:cellulose synthase/poly-beta-1,6-N-acetylglucosamine synthase-like glycosyltransferase